MRFLQTSDWQLGFSPRQAGSLAGAFSKRRFAAVERLVELAERERVDLVMLVGDTFDSPDVDDEVVVRAVTLLDRLAPCPVYVLPGNHDPLGDGSVWNRASWKGVGDHVHLMAEAVELDGPDGIALYPCPVTQKVSRKDPTQWIPLRAPGDDRIRVGIAHGSLGLVPHSVNFPIAADRRRRAGLDYLALGDWHGLKIGDGSGYSGTIEATSFSETDTGCVLLVEIDPESRAVDVDRGQVGDLMWLEVAGRISDESDVEDLEQRFGEHGRADSLVLRVRLEVDSSLSETASARLAAVRADLESGVFFLDWSAELQSPRLVSLPPGVITEVSEALDAMLAEKLPAAAFSAFANQDPAVVSEAQTLLRRLASESASSD